MNEAHWHLVVNHLPIIFPIVGVIVMVTGLLSKSEAVRRTAFMIFILGSLTAIAAIITGEGAEDVVKKISGINEQYIEIHEKSAEVFAIMSYILGGLSLVGLWVSFKQKSFSTIYSIVILVFALVVLFFGKQTGTTGGEIQHIEIRSDYNINTTFDKDSHDKKEDD